MRKGIFYGLVAGNTSDADKLALIKDAGFDGIEITAYEKLCEAEAVASAARDAGLEIASVMAATHWSLPLSSTDESVRTQGVAGIEHAIRVAVAAGTDAVLVVPGVVDQDTAYAAAHELAHKSLRELLPAAEQAGVTLLLENVWNKFLLSPLEMRTFIDSFDSPHIQVYFDVGNILLYGFPHQWIETLGDRIKRVHVKDFSISTRQFVSLLSGDVDYPRTVNALRGVGYDGYLTAEVPCYRHYPERFVRDTAAQIDAIIASGRCCRSGG